jgi:serine/threonine-protein kinase
MSRVFVAQDKSLGRTVAIKVFSPEVAAEVKAERFRLEIQLAAKLQHPHIVPLLFAGENRGILYFTMPYIDGESLRAKLAREGPLPIPEAMRTLRHIASALAYAHKQGVVHRDIKPDNVLLSGEFALVTDFGVAKALSASTTADGAQPLTSSGMTIGTPAYMAPEQALADPNIDHRADIYAFGIVAYEVITGSPPFHAKTAQGTLAAHITEEPAHIATHRADIPASAAALVMQCLAKNPDDRPQNASDLLHVFDALATSSAPHMSIAVPPPPVPGPRSRRTKRWIVPAIGVAALAVIGYATLGPRGPGGAADLSSIAVLPLENQGTGKEDEYFSDGMTDELASALSKLPGVRVASRTSAYAFKGTRTNIEEVGRKLNVQAVIEGTVRRAGDRLRVSAQLTSVRDGLTLWSDTYDRETRDVFAVQDDIARSIAAALRPRIGSGASAAAAFAPESQGTTDLPAYDQYLRGRYLWNARGADNLRRAISYFDSAIVRDPQFAKAHAARAIAFALLPEYTDMSPADASVQANQSAKTALSLDPNLAEAYAALGLAGVHDWKFREAEAAYRKAIEIDPRYPTGHQWYGELLFHTGRIDSSLVQIRTAAELDPLAPIIPAALSYGLTQAGKLDEAVQVLNKGVELAPNLGLHHAMLGIVYLRKGDNRRAIQSMEQAARLDSELAVRQGYLAYVYAKSGNRARAQQIVDRLEARRKAERVPPVSFLVAYLGLGEYDKALDALEEAARDHDVSLFSVSSLVPDEIYDPVRSNPRFTAVLRQMNLLEYVHKR